MTTLSQEELDGIYAFAVDLGKKAGQMLIDAAQIRIDGGNADAEQKEHVQKENAVDLVTQTDEGMSGYSCMPRSTIWPIIDC
jgi:myo-inositol-1(or 4)-monophosphatase